MGRSCGAPFACLFAQSQFCTLRGLDVSYSLWVWTPSVAWAVSAVCVGPCEAQTVGVMRGVDVASEVRGNSLLFLKKLQYNTIQYNTIQCTRAPVVGQCYHPCISVQNKSSRVSPSLNYLGKRGGLIVQMAQLLWKGQTTKYCAIQKSFNFAQCPCDRQCK